jgi:hypothetical protein
MITEMAGRAKSRTPTLPACATKRPLVSRLANENEVAFVQMPCL